MAGLGNPGDRYTGTRHNVGFDVVDAFARRYSGPPPTRIDRLDCRALTGRVRLGGVPVLLAKPQTYMNLSGESIKGLAAKLDVPLERMVVVLDELALPVGRLRLRPSGSSAGHKGLQNVIDCFKTNAFPRLRVGIAGEHFHGGEDRIDYVLERFSRAERPVIDDAVEDAVAALEVWITQGLEPAMTRFNRSPEEVPASTSHE